MIEQNGRTPRMPPGPPLPRPLQTAAWILRPGPFMETCRRRYGDVFSVRLTGVDFVFLSDPEDVKRVFTGDPKLLRAGEANAVLRPVLGPRSMLLLDEPEHMVHRKLMLPPFHGQRMQRYGELMTAAARTQIATWPVGEPFPLRPRMQSITLEVILRAVFGITDSEPLERPRELLRRLLNFTTGRRQLASMALLTPEQVESSGPLRDVLRPVDSTVHEVIRRRRAATDLDQREDILSMLLQARYEDGEPMSDADLRDELITLLIAGHETTATALAWAFERLLRHPEKLARLREEVRAGEGAYVDAVIKETLRLRPVVPIVGRRLAEPMEFGGHLIPAGVSVAPCIYLIHRREDVYPDPGRFWPERFLERPAGTYTWIPFGGGVRRCLGASFAEFEMRKVLETVVSEVELEPERAASERVVRRSITLIPSREASVVVRSRVTGDGVASAGSETRARPAKAGV